MFEELSALDLHRGYTHKVIRYPYRNQNNPEGSDVVCFSKSFFWIFAGEILGQPIRREKFNLEARRKPNITRWANSGLAIKKSPENTFR